ncbi:hypothetical protein A3A84_02115 [Candidatus Collierbacteria bacterium RIFCSPLOWO2_01_FULL_50_23]|uniref:Uncharacterized protein n=1 Tax=Candidatus Collierbacteria bacterium RIFCSPHIGHO2_01_FULL_50_25 TaxID=1817722 RepID=A0A1F5EUZ2_9BACT|nr:MAG: hypothetical protein A2703_02520 [Candidatus Collierbacteria bacterium RIFCSPHIGHO2_01_FULL_50_25]OGD73757.1 MAG: hypothetical protein A3A84_02115 [Candidatus Collierbacteria bacterium RIFCSPLOWO2_01_FULL_50_23]
MAGYMSRREFLKHTWRTLSALPFIDKMDRLFRVKRYDLTTGIEIDSDDEHVSFAEAAQLCRHLGDSFRRLDLDHWREELTVERLKKWTEIVVLQMNAEDFIDWPDINRANDEPDESKLFYVPKDGSDANHVLGVSDCQTTAKLTGLFINPYSDLYNSPDWLGIRIHELVHKLAQETTICKGTPPDQMEASANIIMLLTLAAMANRGMATAFKSFVFEFTDVCLGATRYLVSNEEELREYEEIRTTIRPGIISQTRYEKLNREYSGNQYERLEILKKYSYLPLEKIMRAHLKSHDLLKDLTLQPRFVYPKGSSFNVAPHYEPRIVNLHNWSWIMFHLEELTDSFLTFK